MLLFLLLRSMNAFSALLIETTTYSSYAEQCVTNVCSFNCLKWPGLLSCETDVVFYKNLPVALSVIRHLSKSLSFILCLLMTS